MWTIAQKGYWSESYVQTVMEMKSVVQAMAAILRTDETDLKRNGRFDGEVDPNGAKKQY